MLTKGDKDAIREIVRGELKEALCRMITIERGPRQQGDPEKAVREEQWNVLDFMAAYAPRIEAALKGMQEDVDRTKNNVAGVVDRINAIGSTLLGMEQVACRLADTSDKVRLLSGGRNVPG